MSFIRSTRSILEGLNALYNNKIKSFINRNSWLKYYSITMKPISLTNLIERELYRCLLPTPTIVCNKQFSRPRKLYNLILLTSVKVIYCMQARYPRHNHNSTMLTACIYKQTNLTLSAARYAHFIEWTARRAHKHYNTRRDTPKRRATITKPRDANKKTNRNTLLYIQHTIHKYSTTFPTMHTIL